VSAPSPPRGPLDPASPSGLVEHYFRHEYGRLVALLVRRVGLRHLETVEDAVQTSLLAALTAWVTSGIPHDSGAWLYRVAHNHLLGVLRKDHGHQSILDAAADEGGDSDEHPISPAFAGEVRDELLRMLFVCCDEKIPQDSRLVLALKTLCGFSTGEIALRLFTSEANVHKRLARARDRLRESDVDTQTPPLESLRSRLPSVHAVIYLLFNEGYLSTNAEHAIRAELCDEAIRLGTLLANHAVGAAPPTFALLALMHLHAARLASRQDATGGLLLLEEQDRSRWDVEHLQQGAIWLERAGHGDTFTRFHAEAGVAAEHCFAPSFAETAGTRSRSCTRCWNASIRHPSTLSTARWPSPRDRGRTQASRRSKASCPRPGSTATSCGTRSSRTCTIAPETPRRHQGIVSGR
jgi:RNA polymerase sigma factor (sigma-70 family)